VGVPHKAVTAERECLSCHVRHAAKNEKLLFAKEEKVCYSCHEKTKVDLASLKPHKPFVEGRCSVCHNSHGSNFVGMMRTRMDTVCYNCHVEAELKFIKTNTHKPVIDGNCNGCHKPHGSNEENLLMVAAEDPVMCAKCHGDLMKEAVDGSNHQVFKDGKCLKCHEVHGSNHPGMTVAKQGFLCYSCHSTDPGKDVKNIKSRHAPVVSGECTTCHSPHKANLKSLLLARYPDLCLACHTDLKAKMYKEDEGAPTSQSDASGGTAGNRIKSADTKIYVHALSDLEKCQTCHTPHFSAELALIVEPIQALCSRCHDYKELSFRRAHINIRAGKMDCRKCHAPHTSNDPKFFKAEVHKPFADRACKDCHIVTKP